MHMTMDAKNSKQVNFIGESLQWLDDFLIVVLFVLQAEHS